MASCLMRLVLGVDATSVMVSQRVVAICLFERLLTPDGNRGKAAVGKAHFYLFRENSPTWGNLLDATGGDSLEKALGVFVL